MFDSQWTELHEAAGRGDLETTKSLLASGANINATDREGRTPLHAVLLKKYFHFPGYKNGKPLRYYNHLAVLQILLENGANVNATDNSGMTPLLLSIKNKQSNVAMCLVEKGANVNQRGPDGNNSLYTALKNMEFCPEHLLLCLIKNGVDTKVKTRNFTVLHYASQVGHHKVVKLLLEKGTELDAVDKSGDTALHQAAENKQTDVVWTLLSKGANTYIYNRHGKTAKDVSECSEITMMLHNHQKMIQSKMVENNVLPFLKKIDSKLDDIKKYLENMQSRINRVDEINGNVLQ